MVLLEILMVDTGVVMRSHTLFRLGFDELEMFCLGGRDDLEARIARMYLSVALWVDHIESVP